MLSGVTTFMYISDPEGLECEHVHPTLVGPLDSPRNENLQVNILPPC